jgi:glycosyltransferase involved in cell wall biosynthesis
VDSDALQAVQDAQAPDVARLRILHLAFEDFRRPGSGGGSVRTHEVARRLAERHDITMITTSYPGARERIEDGVHYVPVGAPLGYFGSILTYFLVLPWVVRRYDCDLIVEDFAAPFSSVLVPLWTRRPTVALVQWLFARLKSRQYHLPFFLFERWGVRLHSDFIAVSDWTAAELHAMNRHARIDVIRNGVEREAFKVTVPKTDTILFLGRLEIEEKGLDLLLEALGKVAASTTARMVIAGDGVDADATRRLCRRYGLEGRVEFVGRVTGREKLELIASSQVLCMPTRFENSPIVPIEALACSTPVLAFDIEPMRAVVPEDCGVLVSAFDVDLLAAELQELLVDPERCAAMGRRGRQFAAQFDWDAIAAEQERVYLRVAAAGESRRGSRARTRGCVLSC